MSKYSNNKESIIERMEFFKQKANELYNNKYKYFDDYVNTQTEIEVECPIHGIFKVKPIKHLNGFECPICKPRKIYKHTVDSFLKKALQIHGDEYEYPYIENEINNKKITIKHKKCGNQYLVNKLSHLMGNKCKYCYGTMHKSFEDFVKQANEIHNNQFIYFEDTYKNDKSKTKMQCKKCGYVFWQTVNAHLRGNSCPKCAHRNRTTEDILNEFENIHRNKYIYCYFDYKRNTQKITIKCKNCGNVFTQTVAAHLKGQGCPKCKKSKLEILVMDIFNDNNVKYIYQCRKDNLPFLNRLSLDFFIEELNVGIECQGKQHFNLGGWKEPFEVIKERDERKKKLCEENNVKLIYINYFDSIDEINNKLQNIIKEYDNKNNM